MASGAPTAPLVSPLMFTANNSYNADISCRSGTYIIRTVLAHSLMSSLDRLIFRICQASAASKMLAVTTARNSTMPPDNIPANISGLTGIWGVGRESGWRGVRESVVEWGQGVRRRVK